MLVNVVIDNSINCNPLLNYKSAFLTFPYYDKLINYIKNLRYRYYDANKKSWEIQYQDLISLCKTFPDIQFDIIDSYKEPVENYNLQIPEDYKFNLQPLEYQKEGILYGINHPKFLLGDEMGLGKSLQSIYISDITCKNKVLVIVCSASLKYNWKAEIEKTLGRKDAYVLGTIRKEKKNGTVSKKEGNAQDKLNDLINIDDIKEKFIITNRETITLLNTKKKQGRGYIYNFPIAEKINELCQQKKIGCIILDEAHKGCLTGDSRIITDKGIKTIQEIVENKIKCNVLSYNIKTKNKEFKSILNYQKLPQIGNLLELEFKEGHLHKKIKCTEDHKFFTLNRGWVEAKNLDENDEVPFTNLSINKLLTDSQLKYIIQNIDNKLISEIAKDLKISYSKLKRHINLYNIPVDEDKQKQMQLKAQKDTCIKLYGVSTALLREDVLKQTKERAKFNNPWSKEDIKKKCIKKSMETRKNNNNLNCWNGGNGTISPTEKLVKDYMEVLGFEYNKGISTKAYKKEHPEIKMPFCYKPDFIHKHKKICIELDGDTHNSLKQKELDLKKDKVETDLGYKVFRFSNDYVINNLQEFKSKIKEIYEAN